MVSKTVRCEVCDAAPADFHIWRVGGREHHFCGQSCMDRFTRDRPDEHVAFYLTTQAPGAIPNGTPVVKVSSEKGDAHPDGTPGVILGSVGPHYTPQLGRELLAYFVRWEDTPVPIGTMEYKVKPKGE